MSLTTDDHTGAVNSLEYEQCCERDLPIWSNLSQTGAGPRVEGFMFATDVVGLEIWLKTGFLELECFSLNNCPNTIAIVAFLPSSLEADNNWKAQKSSKHHTLTLPTSSMLVNTVRTSS